VNPSVIRVFEPPPIEVSATRNAARQGEAYIRRVASLITAVRIKQRPAGVRWGVWDRRINAFDWLVIGATLLLAGLTLWAWSYPVPGTDVFLFGGIGWSILAIAWAASVLATTIDTAARWASLGLVVGAVASFPLFGISLVVIGLGGIVGFALMVLIGLGLLGVVVATSRVRRVTWLAGPLIVLAMLTVVFTGLPRLGRMAVAEPALTQFAQTVDPHATLDYPMWFDDGFSVGSVPVYEAYVSRGGVHLVTGFVGILGDDSAGIAYFPTGAPAADPPYEHLVGDWYRWYPY